MSGRLRLWPAVVIVVLQAAVVLVPAMIAPGSFPHFMAMIWGPILGALRSGRVVAGGQPGAVSCPFSGRGVVYRGCGRHRAGGPHDDEVRHRVLRVADGDDGTGDRGPGHWSTRLAAATLGAGGERRRLDGRLDRGPRRRNGRQSERGFQLAVESDGRGPVSGLDGSAERARRGSQADGDRPPARAAARRLAGIPRTRARRPGGGRDVRDRLGLASATRALAAARRARLVVVHGGGAVRVHSRAARRGGSRRLLPPGGRPILLGQHAPHAVLRGRKRSRAAGDPYVSRGAAVHDGRQGDRPVPGRHERSCHLDLAKRSPTPAPKCRFGDFPVRRSSWATSRLFLPAGRTAGASSPTAATTARLPGLAAKDG